MNKNDIKANIVPVILCGGSGTRLWPESRGDKPKQFLKLMGDNSLLQDTMQRAVNICDVPAERLVTVTLGDLRDNVHEQILEIFPDITEHHIICEPVGRDTAAAVAFAARYVTQKFGEDAVMWILPADHYIGDEDTMALAYVDALEAAQKDYLVTFGIRPTRPETGYGYIKLGSSLKGDSVYNADAFVEKPNRSVAQRYMDSGEYMWNSGMFMFSVKSVLQQFAEHCPDLLQNVDKAMNIAIDSCCADLSIYSSIPKQPFDKAIMEKSSMVAVVPCNPEWSDIGSWESLWEVQEKDKDGNAFTGNVVCHETSNCLIQSNKRLIATAGVEDIVIIETEDALLVADRKNSDVMKSLVNYLKDSDYQEVYGQVSLLSENIKNDKPLKRILGAA